MRRRRSDAANGNLQRPGANQLRFTTLPLTSELAIADADLLGQGWALLIEFVLLLAAPVKLLLPVRALLVSIGQVSELSQRFSF